QEAEVEPLDDSSALPADLEGPWPGPFLEPVVLGMAQLKPALRRQLSRRPSTQLGDTVAARLLGFVCLFKVCEVRVAPDGDWPRLRQAPLESALESAEVQLAAAKCQEMLQEHQALLCESGPSGREVLAFLAALRELADRPLLFFPLVEMLWQSLQHGLIRTFTSLLENFLAHLLEGPAVLYLGPLDGPLPTENLQEAWWPLRRPGLQLLGSCRVQSAVRPALRALFETTASLDLRAAPSKGAAPEKVDLIGQEEMKRELAATVLQYFTSAEMFHRLGLAWPPRTLVHGPPGCGKTQLLRWLAAE
ncbi:unnamed protein product, partial [Effrenium voratum]